MQMMTKRLLTAKQLLCFERHIHIYFIYDNKYHIDTFHRDSMKFDLVYVLSYSLYYISLATFSYIYIQFTGSIKSSYEYYVELRNPTIEVEHHQSLVWNLFAKSNASVLVHHWWLMEWWMAWSVFAWIQYGRHKFEILLLFV